MEEYCGNFRHEHPLVPMSEGQISNQSEEAKCWMCGEKVSAPCFSCSECHVFYLHKLCAEAPSEINHPFHDNHPLVLMPKAPYLSKTYECDFCDKVSEKFVYHCSCELDFHIKCALFTYNIAEKNLKELEHVLEDPLISTENDGKELEDLSKCFVCWEPLTNYTYFSLDCGFNLHKKCVELPFKINLMCHHNHPLILQFHFEGLSCEICHCKLTPRRGFVYGCLPCKFAIHIECSSVSPIVKDKNHLHPFTLFRRRAPFICDACSSEGNYVAYICCECNIIVHKRCISLPRIIKSKWHDNHLLFHNYFLKEEDFESWDCIICHDKVNAKFGSYSCLVCKFIFHVNCVIKDENSYFVVSLENEDEKSNESLELPDMSSITCVFQQNDAGEATEIKHFLHVHNLMLGEKIMKYEKYCDGCMLPISDSFYYCSQCDFFLHKACAELPKLKYVWHHDCRKPLMLTSNNTFRCEKCGYRSNVFAYRCVECKNCICLRCVRALTPGDISCPKHEHPLIYYKEYEGQCSACGDDIKGAFLCKNCKFNFALDHRCFSLSIVARHKCDEHLLALTYHDDNTYSESHYCDICEERRDPNLWFYHCATCDTSAHVKCVLGQHPFVKLGGFWEFNFHPHPVTLTRKIYDYPDCTKCNKPCKDLVLECTMSGCNCIVDLECLKP